MDEIFIFDFAKQRANRAFYRGGCAERNSDLIAFNFHPSAASVALLSAPKLVVNPFDINFQSGWQAFNNSNPSALPWDSPAVVNLNNICLIIKPEMLCANIENFQLMRKKKAN